MKLRACILGLLLFALSCGLWADDEHHHGGDPDAKLGTVNFPVPSCSAAVQKPFERGVALLHSFWYDEAYKQFEAVAAQDPHCAMAYWGEAISLYHQLWDRPTPATVKQGAALAKKGQAIGAKTPREKGYLDAIAVFYSSPQAKWDFEKRATAYSHAMGKLYKANPDDQEAAAFYALSLLGSEPKHDTTFANRREAIAILYHLFDENPDHPGMAHYLIHACDNPQFAQQGLMAARRYAQIAPASPHALHMPSHIFARLGLWQEDINSNLASIAAIENNHSGMHMGAEHEAHAMDFLEYAYLQVGDDAKAKALVDKIAAIKPEDMDPGMTDYLNFMKVHMPALYFLETKDWKAAMAMTAPADIEFDAQAVAYWAQAVAAGHLHDAAAAQHAVSEYDRLMDATRKSSYAYVVDGMATGREEASAWLAFAQGKDEEAVGLLKSVADKQDALGKGEVELPAREMLADMLLELDRPEEALAQYQKSMKVDPNRFNGLAGAARAAELAHQPEKAATFYSALTKNCAGVESERPELTAARKQLAQK